MRLQDCAVIKVIEVKEKGGSIAEFVLNASKITIGEEYIN